MPLPNRDDVHVNRLLANISVGHIQSDTKFVAGKVFARVPVLKKSDRYATYSKADFMRDEMAIRAPGSESAGGGYRVTTTDTYSCERYSFHVDVDDDEVANQDDPFNASRDAAIYLGQKDLIKREVAWGTSYFTTGVWTGSSTSTDLVAGTDFVAFDDVSSQPIELINDEMANVESKTGMLPNTLVVNRRGWMAIKNHPDVVDRIKHTSRDAITTEMVARLLELDRILVAGGARNSAQEGLTGSYNYILGNHALLVYTTPTPGLFVPSGGYTFVWTGMPNTVNGVSISEIPAPLKKSTRYEIESNWDMKLVAGDVGVFFQNIVS